MEVGTIFYPAYDIARVKAMGGYKFILWESKFREIINSEENY